MKIIYSEEHKLHHGAKELNRGNMVPLFEMPSRAEMIVGRLNETGFGDLEAPQRFGDEPILAVHAADYVGFLRNAWNDWVAEEGDEQFAIAWVFPCRGLRQTAPKSIHGKLGYYAFDVAIPIVEGTWRAASAAADVALTGGHYVSQGLRAAFSLCRPPGHHAMRDLGGGYCYLNNAAIATQAFLDAGASRIAVLDVDYHHGNGTQSIFYKRDDVLFVSLHGDPETEFPYYAGYADESGEADGLGFNLNLPLPSGTAWDQYEPALLTGAGRIAEYAPDALVVSLGVDTFKNDPISKFRLENEDYLRIGERIAELGLPTLFVMEGGYAVQDIGVNTVNVLTGFEERA
ncbi:MAG: histone deacetylase family protein [Gammaproteobacteria bacterium]|nr:histone deacetylase family protein [Gammaproteobacteria bacterium]